MAESTLTEVFGTTATQDTDTIILEKSEILAKAEAYWEELKGANSFSPFTPSNSNTAEALCLCILLCLAKHFTQARRDNDTSGDTQIVCEFSRESLESPLTDGGSYSMGYEFAITAYQPFTLPALNAAQF